ncbi:MAG: hypothetical protein U1D67_03180 [Dehalococcoidia bacterium]|nr:hypothetical protein [Dehalococcoidia bacterium]
MSIGQSDAKWLKKVFKYYDLTKELLIYGEQVDPESKTSIQAINELRNCLDHLMRVAGYRVGLHAQGEGEEYVTTNFDKSFSHLYRAAYDTLDWVALTIKKRVLSEIKDYSPDTIAAVIPNYYSDLRPRFETILNKEIVTLRAEKDVAVKNEENLVECAGLISELKSTLDILIDKKSAFVEHHKALKRQRWQGWVITGVIALGVTTVGTLIAWFIIN